MLGVSVPVRQRYHTNSAKKQLLHPNFSTDDCSISHMTAVPCQDASVQTLGSSLAEGGERALLTSRVWSAPGIAGQLMGQPKLPYWALRINISNDVVVCWHLGPHFYGPGRSHMYGSLQKAEKSPAEVLGLSSLNLVEFWTWSKLKVHL